MTENECYEAFARAVKSICPPNFEQARLVAEMDDGWSRKTYQYKSGGTWSAGQSVASALDFDVDDALLELHAHMQQDRTPNWTGCTFTLEPDGKFSIEFIRPN